MTKIEKISRMLANRTLHVRIRGGTVDDLIPSDDGPIPLWQMHAKTVRLVIKGLREPTEAMTQAGERVPIDVIISSGADAVWTAMIDTLLAEGDAPAAERSTKCAACGGSGSVPSGYAPGMGPATSACRICGGTG